jgi:metallothionein
MASEAKKCAHPVCSCSTTKKYCSEACEAMEKTSDIDCRCNHPACQGKVR